MGGVRLVCEDAIRVGAGSAISWDVIIMDSDLHAIDGRRDPRPVSIGDHVWIGAKVVITKGVTVGDGAVIGAGSIVVHDVPGGALVAGNPARVVREVVTWSP
jgi:acetyltransferase-like isoleucine patch superfamily enzyme